jgi:hypothetical protein
LIYQTLPFPIVRVRVTVLMGRWWLLNPTNSRHCERSRATWGGSLMFPCPTDDGKLKVSSHLETFLNFPACAIVISRKSIKNPWLGLLQMASRLLRASLVVARPYSLVREDTNQGIIPIAFVLCLNRKNNQSYSLKNPSIFGAPAFSRAFIIVGISTPTMVSSFFLISVC